MKLPITLGDIAFLVEELYRGRSVVADCYEAGLDPLEQADRGTLLRIGEGKDGAEVGQGASE